MPTSWWSIPLPLVAAVSMLLVPGLLATAALRVGWIARIALAATVSVASLGAGAIAFGFVGVPFAAWQAFVPAAILGALAVAARRRGLALRLPRERVGFSWLVATWVAAVAVIAVVAFADVSSPDLISQSYDNVFHLSAIAHILESGDGSSLTLRTLIETAKTWSFYPSAWHTLVVATVQLSGASVPVAVNAAWIAVCAAVWLPSVAWLTQVLLRRHEPGRVALVALPLAAAFASMPYVLLTWGTLYPTFLATALLPVAIAVPVATWTARGTVRRRHRTGLWVTSALALLISMSAVGVSQPRVLATWALLIAPFVIVQAASWFLRSLRRGGGHRRRALRMACAVAVVAVAVLAAAFWYLVTRLGLFDRPLDDRLGGPQAAATQSIPTGLWQALIQSWPTGVGDTTTFPALLLAAAVLVGLVALWRRPSQRWIVVSYVLVAVLFAIAAGSDEVVAKLATALWYKDRYRLSSAVPVIAVAAATIGVLTASRWARLRGGWRRSTAVSVVLAWAVALTASTGLLFAGGSAAVGAVFRMPTSDATGEVVSEAQIEFMGTLGGVVPADQRVLGDPWDGSALTQLYGDREPVFPHVNGRWDPARRALAFGLQNIESDPTICAALDSLRVRYLLYNPHEFGGGDPAGNLFFGVHAAAEAGLFPVVATDGDSVLYRIEQCGPLT